MAKYDDDEHKTIWQVKIKGSRWKRDLWTVCKMLFFVASFFAMFAAMQIVLCREDHPGRAMLDCLRPKK